MLPRLLVANWKSNKTIEEARVWIEFVSQHLSTLRLPDDIRIVLCPPFTTLPLLKDYIVREHLPIALGAQDVSPFGKGAYTGEVNADMLKELVTFALVGHSERRKYFQETEEELAFESLQAREAGISVIYCVDNADAVVSDAAEYIAYEPVAAIGSGQSEDPQKANSVCETLYKRYDKPVCYGGSVDETNCALYMNTACIHGLLVGGASLDAERFCSMVEAISSQA